MGMGNRRVFEHSLVKNVVKQGQVKSVHHKNQLKDDNRPTNLKVMSQSKHMAEHMYKGFGDFKTTKDLAVRKSCRRYELDYDWALKVLKENDYKPTVFRDKYGFDYETVMTKLKQLGIDWEYLFYKNKFNAHVAKRRKIGFEYDWAMQELMANQGSPTVFSTKYGYQYTHVQKELKRLGIDFAKIKCRFDKEGKYIKESAIARAVKFDSVKQVAKYLNVGEWKARTILKYYGYNHMVVKVIHDNKVQDVYDITVEKYHNFVANGICVHNCRTGSSNPNQQNIPSRGALAKLIKQQFIAPEGKILFDYDLNANEVKNWGNVSYDSKIADAFGLGMQLRRKLRIWSHKKPKTRDKLVLWLEKVKWFESPDKGGPTTEQKEKYIKTKEKFSYVLKILLELEFGGDVHRRNYSFFFGIPANEVSKAQRQSVKTIVFGVLYGKSAESLSREIVQAAAQDSAKELSKVNEEIAILEKMLKEKTYEHA